MKLFKFKKILAGLAAAAMFSSATAAVGALNDSSFEALASSNHWAQGCFEKYKKQFGDNATKTNAFEIVKQYQDKIDGLILIFENHEKRLCAMEGNLYVPKTDLSFFSKGNFDNKECNSELIIERCKKHAIYDECFERFENDSDIVDIIRTYQGMVDIWVSTLIVQEVRIQDLELKFFKKISHNNLLSEFLMK